MSAQADTVGLSTVADQSYLMWLMMRFVGGIKKSSTPANGVRMRCWPWPALASVMTCNREAPIQEGLELWVCACAAVGPADGEIDGGKALVSGKGQEPRGRLGMWRLSVFAGAGSEGPDWALPPQSGLAVCFLPPCRRVG